MPRMKGREVQVEISKTLAAPITITAITKASPPVASATAHGLAAGAVGFLNGVTGMVTLDGQAVRVLSPSTDAFSLADLTTVGLPDFTAGTFVRVSEWASFGTITSFEMSGGEGIESDVGTLHDSVDQIEYGGLSAQSFSFNSLFELPNGEAMTLLRNAARAQAFVVLRITAKTGEQIIARVQPSLPTASLSKGETGTRTFGAAVKGQVLELAAVA